MIPRTTKMALSTGRRVRVRADLSVRVMRRSGLVTLEESEILLDALEDVVPDGEEMAQKLQDALVMHVLDASDASVLNALADSEFVDLLRFAIGGLRPAPIEDEFSETDEEAITEEPAELTIEDELEQARNEALPEVKVPASAEVLARMEAASAE